MDTAPLLVISDITDADVPAIIALWQRCGLARPWNDPASDIGLARRGDNATVLVGRVGGAIAASA
ncbi:MAG: GNAT family N-acetyltransferase, partial [Bradyrhizobium sp.]